VAWASGVPAGATDADGFDYDNDLTGQSEKLTYLSPNWNGFQAGVSYTFDVGDAGSVAPIATGFNADNVPATYGSAWEVAARYEGMFSNVGYAFGAGYTSVDVEAAPAVGTLNDLEEWNVGLDVDAGPFGIGAIYTEGDAGTATREDVDTWVVGVDYTTGPFKFGASYFTQDDETIGATDLETDRWTGGVIYTAGPGLSFRGSVSNIDHEIGAANADATSVMGGVQINF
jgi:predicted porin